MENRVLIIEDAEEICRFVSMALTDKKWLVSVATSLNEGLREASTRQPDIVILDLGLPDGDGQQFIVDFRSWSQVPIIVLSARTEETEKVKALNNGADDYLAKPFGMAELIARVEASLRRSCQIPMTSSEIIRLSDVVINKRLKTVIKDEHLIHLTKTELKLLLVLLEEPGKVLTQSYLLKKVWGPSFIEHGHYVRTYMRRLRNKLELDPTRPKHFLTEVGIGYRIWLND
ncbi:two-component system response regulator KdpE [Photobacterium kishitanii]|uniref:Two-component system response regulator KdpE n=1 Tax=Photobacterium kishitanii TaxID=318456 RepID=A0AAX0YX83_9GAMM|nr:response regulator [Photobacterium kishitanii]PSU97774.1 two-component system response regulator KdpE [Photobacterium kishitanii]PSV07827.1 two-component system response regulator KdpE [Photobacterium kishitanii]PSV16155.1 two-component system response regulator KdpE [Photobacterium kishitanii]PSV76315.1 two-component system response regulator KdpE [Photobacterium kishitanii]PSX19955.1 two-component system response regulator KdpE [Photobacterium kishitanii]